MNIKLPRLLLALALGAGFSAPLSAQQGATDAAIGTTAAADFAEGEVRKVDKAGRKVTLKHGEIKNLEMPPMTMVFAVADPALLDQVQTGDKVRFKAIDQGGKLTVTELQPAR